MAGVPAVIVTVGTPVDQYFNADSGPLRTWADESIRWLDDDQLVVIRSTVKPATTQWMHTYLASQGKKPDLAYCPERIAQGYAIDELQELPQLVSGITRQAEDRAADLFSRIAPEIIRLTPLEAEYAKLFTNAYRYITFAAANQFYMLAKDSGVDFSRISDACRHNYPRMSGMPSAGFAAGPCLFKDTMQLVACHDQRFTLGIAAMFTNEGLPGFLLDQLKRDIDLSDRTVGIIGMAFKAESDDPRDSLSYKLRKLLVIEARCVLCTDPYVRDDRLVSLEKTIADSDVLFLATPHACYRDVKIPPTKKVVDVWNWLPPTRDP